MCTTTSSPVLFCKKPRGTKRPWYRLFEKDTPVLLSAGALSIQQKFWFEISKIPRALWNGSFRFHRPVPSHRVFAYCSLCKQDTKERYWGQQFCQMEGLSVGPTEMSGLVKVNHLQRLSQIFRSDRTEMARSIWFLIKICGYLAWMESAPEKLGAINLWCMKCDINVHA